MDKKFTDDQIEILNYIFEIELKPPFSKGEMNKYGVYSYYNRDGECIGQFYPMNLFKVIDTKSFEYIKFKIMTIFRIPKNYWWELIYPHFISWLENEINVEVNHVYYNS